MDNSKTTNECLLKMLERANAECGTRVNYSVFRQIKSAFAKGTEITYEEICDALRKAPSITKDEVLRLFKAEALASPEVEISSNYLCRVHLIDLIFCLEDYTGRMMTDTHCCYDPIEAYDNKGICVNNIAEFFATGGGIVGEIAKTVLTEAEN